MRRDSNIKMAWLEAFESAARTLSFTKAAEELGLSQGAVSIQIRNLEKALGAALFERRGRHIVLTDEGLAYSPQVSETLATLHDTTSRLFTGSRRNVVAISCFSPTFADYWIAPRIPGLMATFPEVQFDITIDYQALGTRSAYDDLVFTVESAVGPQLLPMVEENLVAVCSPDYLAKHEDGWMDGALIESVGSRETWLAWKMAYGEQQTVAGREVRVNSMSAALKLAENGAGAALVARAFIGRQLAQGSLVELAPGRKIPGRVHGLSTRSLSNMRPLARAVAASFLKKANRPIPGYLTEQ
ncbi:MAG: LysR family transcriptional regulator [Pelagimonas sp.]|nr:LysR family transcriptional regulator [Pelagimonas sp.]